MTRVRDRGRPARTPRCHRQPARVPRLALVLLSTVAALLLGGCVYLRLLELKRQIDKFDLFFALRTDNGLSLTCLTPLLRPSDVRWIGLKPEKTKTLGRAEQWQVRWVKQPPPGARENVEYDIALELMFVEERLKQVTIPERYFAAMPKSFLVGVIRSLGRGKIDKSEKKIAAIVSAEEVAAARPKLPAIDKLLGQPTEEREEGANTMVRYRYVPATVEPGAGVFDMHLTFHTKSGELLRWQGLTPVGKIDFDFTADRRR